MPALTNQQNILKATPGNFFINSWADIALGRKGRYSTPPTKKMAVVKKKIPAKPFMRPSLFTAIWPCEISISFIVVIAANPAPDNDAVIGVALMFISI